MSPRCPLFPSPKPTAQLLPHSHCLFVSIPSSLAKQVEKLRGRHMDRELYFGLQIFVHKQEKPKHIQR